MWIKWSKGLAYLPKPESSISASCWQEHKYNHVRLKSWKQIFDTFFQMFGCSQKRWTYVGHHEQNSSPMLAMMNKTPVLCWQWWTKLQSYAGHDEQNSSPMLAMMNKTPVLCWLWWTKLQSYVGHDEQNSSPMLAMMNKTPVLCWQWWTKLQSICWPWWTKLIQ